MDKKLLVAVQAARKMSTTAWVSKWIWLCISIPNSLPNSYVEEFGNNVICIDSTFKTTGYEFELITILDIDEFDQSY